MKNALSDVYASGLSFDQDICNDKHLWCFSY